MARIAGVNIPTAKRVVIALQYIHGIGAKKAQEIVEKVNIPAERRVNQLTDAEVLAIRETIDRDYLVEGDLRRPTLANRFGLTLATPFSSDEAMTRVKVVQPLSALRSFLAGEAGGGALLILAAALAIVIVNGWAAGNEA